MNDHQAQTSSTPITRRVLLKGMSTAAIVGSICSQQADNIAVAKEKKEKPVAKRIKRAVKFHMIQGKISVLEKFQLLKELGFDGTEIHVTDKSDPEEIRNAVDKTGVVVHGFLNSSKPDLKFAIDRAKYFGGESVLVVAGKVDRKNSYDQVYREQQQRLRVALPYAEKQGIKLLIENVWNNFLLSPLEMARFLDELESDAVGAYFDVGNVVRFGWPEQWIRILGKRIVKLDIKEYSRKIQMNQGVRKGFQVEIGEGDCDWPAVRKALADIGYTSGWATAEVKGGDRNRLAEIKQRMDKVLP